MKSLIFCIALFFTVNVKSQSPSLTINVLMDSARSSYTSYLIEMKICKPVKMSKQGDWLKKDTSSIDFTSLKPKDITCGNYFTKGGAQLISAKKEPLEYNKFYFSNQVFAWEQLYVFRISNRSSRGWWPEMYIVVPMKYKSFVTTLDLTGIEFQSGKLIFINDIKPVYDGFKMNMYADLKNIKGVKMSGSGLKDLLENE